MKTPKDIQQFVQQIRAYEYADGLHEITLGLLAVLTGAAVTFHPFGTSAMGGIGGAVILAALICASTWGITQIRLRFIWPRTGYVKPNWAQAQRFRFTRMAFIVAVEIALIVIMFFTMGHSNRIVVLAVGILLFYAAEWTYGGQVRWLVIALLAPVVALVVSILPIIPDGGVFVMMLYMGLGTLVNGIYALSRYLRSTPAEPST